MASDRSIDVLVIGAGQAGLAAGYWLTCAGTKFLIVDGAERIGDSWRQRYESLTLFTPRRFSALSALALSGEPDGYPSRLEFADYLERYASMWGLPVALNRQIAALTKTEGGFRAVFDSGKAVRARAVIIAAGGFQLPVLPELSSDFDPRIAQLDPEPGKPAFGARAHRRRRRFRPRYCNRTRFYARNLAGNW